MLQQTNHAIKMGIILLSMAIRLQWYEKHKFSVTMYLNMYNKNSDLMQRPWARSLYAQCIQGTDETRKIWRTIQIAIALAEIRVVLSEIGSLMDNHCNIFLYYRDISWHCNQQGPLSSYLPTYTGNFIVIHRKLFSSCPNVKIEDCNKNAVTNFRSLV